jgi:hypothetical protein
MYISNNWKRPDSNTMIKLNNSKNTVEIYGNIE